MTRRDLLRLSGGALVGNALSHAQTPRSARPNIVMVYGDDVGWGDLGCYGATRARTPNLDRLAETGMRFTDAHSSAATCTPSRFSLLTGTYAFRNDRARILPGDAPLLIAPGSVTLASVLRGQGYRTGAVGKWHLGLGEGTVDWNREITPGPRDVGFDYSFLIPATGDRVPCVYVENQRVVGLDPKDPIQVNYAKPVGNEPTGRDHPQLLRIKPSHGHDFTIVNGISRIGYMTGGKSARWVDEEMADTITGKAVQFIEKARPDPFFLYFSTHDIHVPRAPHKRFIGQTPMGPRGDVISELDWSTGRILDALERTGAAANTLVIFTSDNGPVIDDGYQDEAVAKLGNHRAAGPYRGGKYSNFEAGTRVPFIVRWPGRVKLGVSDALVSQTDLLASIASLTGARVPQGAAADSVDVRAALLGEARTGREHLVEQAGTLSIRVGNWKYIPPNPGPAVNKNTATELGTGKEPQLYDLTSDPGETRNVAAQNQPKVREMAALLDRIRKGPVGQR